MTGAQVTFLLLPYGREPQEAIRAANRFLLESQAVRSVAGGLARLGGPLGVGPDTWWMATVDTGPHAVITALHRVDWQHAPLLVYRSVTDDSWSHLRIVRRVAPLWGDQTERRRNGR